MKNFVKRKVSDTVCGKIERNRLSLYGIVPPFSGNLMMVSIAILREDEFLLVIM